MLENLVFINLRKYQEEIYYYKTEKNTEVDFYLPKKKMLIQVSQKLTEFNTKEREVRALLDAMEEINENTGLILTEDEKGKFVFGKKIITILPVYEWLLS